MSFSIIRKNTGSPFYLQRSMVDQGGEGGAYESGGYTGESTYNNDAANAVVESVTSTIGAALSSMTPDDKNKSNIKSQERLEKKSVRLKDKASKADYDKSTRLTNRAARVDARVENKKQSISKFEEEKKKLIPKATIN
jgi:hypothetical protein